MSEPRPLDEAAELVRQFNHESRHLSDDWGFPGDSYRALGELADLARKLEQAVEQIVLPVKSTHQDGRLRVDGGGDPDEAWLRVDARRAEAVYAASKLAYAIDALHSATNPLGAELPADS